MIIQVDTREKARAIKKILKEFDDQNIKYFSSKLYVGDYQNVDNPKIIIDRKQNLSEICNNVVQGHKRFVNELERANAAGFKMIILVEHGGKIKKLEDVKNWYNPRLKFSKMATTGSRLYKILSTMSEKYEFEIMFCNKEETGKRIIEILSKEEKKEKARQ